MLPALTKRTLSYLGLKGEPDEAQLKMAEEAIAEVKKFARPGFAHRYIELKRDTGRGIYCDAPLDISYSSLQRLFEKGESDSLCILVSTLGGAVDRRISFLAENSPSKMILFDAASNAYIEEVTDEFQKRLELPSRTFRFAPGYGDVPLSMQREIFDLMPEIKNIGLTLDGSNMMHPMKSMTGLIGFRSR
ncbi:MAG: hypothetical protein J5685_07610 [Clostridiales bacterium]|nr:hypothetical protein [Clostridiales bacterium]